MKEYYRQAPILYHLGKKDMSKFYLLPRNLMEPIFNQLNGKQGNQIKLMSLLIGTMGDGSFAITEKWVCDRTGMTQSSYNRARKALIDRGWLRLERGMLYVDFNAICRPADYSADMPSEQEACNDSMKTTCHDSGYNKKRKNKNIIDLEKNLSFPIVLFLFRLNFGYTAVYLHTLLVKLLFVVGHNSHRTVCVQVACDLGEVKAASLKLLNRELKKSLIVCFEMDFRAGSHDLLIDIQKSFGCKATFLVSSAGPGIAEVEVNSAHFTVFKDIA